MWDVFEQPYLLLVSAVLAHMVVLVYRAIVPERQRPWQWLIPLALAGSAIGLDASVSTDTEMIQALVKDAVRAAQRQDISRISDCIAQDYSDSMHRTKGQLIDHIRSALVDNPMARLRVLGHNIGLIEGHKAVSMISVMANFKPDSLVAQTYRPIVFAIARLDLTKAPSNRWLIRTIELTEVDKMPATWPQISGPF